MGFILKDKDKGFTLIELLVTMVLASIVMAGIYSSYLSQQRSYLVQEQIVSIQQNLRAAIYIMQREIRMSGFNENGSGPGVQAADAESIKFTVGADVIEYLLFDSGSDGDDDLGREFNEDRDAISENIDALNFVYLGANHNVLNHDDGNWNEGDNREDIRFVRITLVGRSDREDIDYAHSNVYRNSQNEVICAKTDHYHRRSLSMTVECRNHGL